MPGRTSVNSKTKKMVDVIKRNNVKITGEGEKYIVLAHGFGCDQKVWRHLINAFKSAYKIISFDYVGAGQSDLACYSKDRYSSLNGYARDLIDVIEAVNVTDAIFIGHSVSSMIGVIAAIKNPRYFSRLILVAPSPCYINNGDYIGGMEKADLEALLTVMDNNYLGWSSSVAPMVMGNPDVPELGDELTASFCATDPDVAKQFARVTFLSDNRNDLAHLQVESLTLQCSEDMLAPMQVGEYIKEHTPNNTLVVLKATGHCPHLSAPEETTEAINRYLNSIITANDYAFR